MGFFKAGKMIDGYSQLRKGMSRAQVLNLLGNPTGQRERNGIETLIWRNSEFKGWMRGGTIERTIEVDFENGLVIGWDGNNMSASRW